MNHADLIPKTPNQEFPTYNLEGFLKLDMWKAFGYSCKLQAVRLSQCRYVQFLVPRLFFGLTPRHVQVQHRNVSQQFHQDACDDFELFYILNSSHIPMKHSETRWLFYILFS